MGIGGMGLTCQEEVDSRGWMAPLVIESTGEAWWSESQTGPLLLLLSLGWPCGPLLATPFSFDQEQTSGAWEIESEQAAWSCYISRTEVCLCGGNYFSQIKEPSWERNTEKERRIERKEGRKKKRKEGREKEEGRKNGKGPFSPTLMENSLIYLPYLLS